MNWVSFSTPKIPEEAVKQFLERLQTKTKIKVAEADAESKKLKADIIADLINEMGEAMRTQGLPPDIVGEVIMHTIGYLDPVLGDRLQLLYRPMGTISGTELLQGTPARGKP